MAAVEQTRIELNLATTARSKILRQALGPMFSMTQLGRHTQVFDICPRLIVFTWAGHTTGGERGGEQGSGAVEQGGRAAGVERPRGHRANVGGRRVAAHRQSVGSGESHQVQEGGAASQGDGVFLGQLPLRRDDPRSIPLVVHNARVG